ncbi:MAG: hypothetical protein P1V97_37340 [Planctomycetota bacterium]|nr:hypothetical protein [Planctomycetota bacterium]
MRRISPQASLTMLVLLLCFLGCEAKETGTSEGETNAKPGVNAEESSEANKPTDLQSKYERARALESQGDFVKAHTMFKEIQNTKADFKDIDTRLDGYGELLAMLTDIKDLETDPASLRATYHVDVANFLMARGTDYYGQAKVYFNLALTLDPMHFGAHRAMASFALQDAQHKVALNFLKKACEIKSDKAAENADAHYQLATIYRTLEAEEGGDLKLALKNAELAVKFGAPEKLDYPRLVAELYFETKQLDKARFLAGKIADMKGATDEDKERVEEYKAP